MDAIKLPRMDSETVSREIGAFVIDSVLAIGAYLVLKGELSVGAMVASMFLSIRVFVPVGTTRPMT